MYLDRLDAVKYDTGQKCTLESLPNAGESADGSRDTMRKTESTYVWQDSKCRSTNIR